MGGQIVGRLRSARCIIKAVASEQLLVIENEWQARFFDSIEKVIRGNSKENGAYRIRNRLRKHNALMAIAKAA
ncbi:MAG: hypothetical protein ACI9G1_000135 [Pirellulaceae bacterium]